MSLRPSRQLGNILRAVPSATTAGEARKGPETKAEGTSSLSAVTPSVSAPANAGPIPTPDVETDTEVPLQVTVPKRIRRELLMMAADQDCSVRALVLRSIRSLGIQVDEKQLRDKRRKP